MLPLVVDDEVFNIGDVTDWAVDLLLAIPLIGVEQFVFRADCGETNFPVGVMAVHHELAREATSKQSAGDLEYLALLVVLTKSEGNRLHVWLLYIS